MKLSKKRNPNEQNYSAVKQRRNNAEIAIYTINRRFNGGLKSVLNGGLSEAYSTKSSISTVIRGA